MVNNILIFGDSYSTYEGQIPEGYAPYYAPDGTLPDHPVSKMELDQTWWRMMIERTGYNLVMNNSWSGSTICYTGYNGDCSKTSSFICRYIKLKENGFFDSNKIDAVLVFGGTNDSWVPSPLGEIKLSDWDESDLYKVRPAICYFLSCLKNDLPDARIVFVANCDISQEIIDCIKLAAKHFGIELVELCGIDKQCGHPTPKGMEQICDQVLKVLAQDK